MTTIFLFYDRKYLEDFVPSPEVTRKRGEIQNTKKNIYVANFSVHNVDIEMNLTQHELVVVWIGRGSVWIQSWANKAANGHFACWSVGATVPISPTTLVVKKSWLLDTLPLWLLQFG